MIKRLFVAWLLAALVAAVLITACKKGPEPQARGDAAPGSGGSDKAVYITKTIAGKEKVSLSFDLAAVPKPESPAAFAQAFHFPPLEQGNTGTCWCFSTTSFLESELKRLGKGEHDLSELFPVYWEFVEKARRFIRMKGDSFLGDGSEPHSAIERIYQYGIVRASDYSGLLPGKTAHDHDQLLKEFREYLESCRSRQDWDEEKALAGVRAILDKHLGKPPDKINLDGKELTPKEYLESSLGLNLSDYVSVMSFLYLPFYTRGEYKVPDNWWHDAGYYNVPLDEFYEALAGALGKGFSAVLAADFSEPGYSGENDIAVVPSFDIPQGFIDQSSREFRFSNKTSTDDHAVHCVGFKEGRGHAWFLIKDSWKNAWWGTHKGYFFYRDDYIRVKVLAFMTHKDAIPELLAKFI